jgi:hypothetical protein
MRDRGTRILDRAETRQVRWLVVSADDCPGESAEQKIIRGCFPVPHAAWTWPPAFVGPVLVYRTRRRVLFRQQAGILLEAARSLML